MIKNELIEALFEKFPEIKETGLVTRNHVRAITGHGNIPAWLNLNKVERSLYSLKPIENKPVEMKSPDEIIAKPTINDSFDVRSLIPAKDPTYVPFGNWLDLETIIKSKIFFPVYIQGLSGNGKSTQVEQICAKLNRPMIRVNINQMTDEDQLIGSKTLVNGNIEIVEGPIILAMRHGMVCVLDELDCAHPNLILMLNGISEGKPFYFKLKNEVITPASGFNLIATANTKGKGSDDGRFIGTNVLNEAFLERFAVTMIQDYPSLKTEMKILTNVMTLHNCLDEDFAKSLAKWASSIRITFEDGGCDEIITTRRLIHIIKTFAVFKDKRKAIELALNRFDPVTKSSFIGLFDKISWEEEVVEIKEFNVE